MTFADKVKTLRKEKGLTQMQLASATNISLGVIADIESNRRTPSKEVAKRMAEFFNVPVETFILENSEIQPATKHVNTADIIAIADVVQEFFQKNGYQITPEQRVALIDHFYQQNITDAKQIKEMLSLMQTMQSKVKLG